MWPVVAHTHKAVKFWAGTCLGWVGVGEPLHEGCVVKLAKGLYCKTFYARNSL